MKVVLVQKILSIYSHLKSTIMKSKFHLVLAFLSIGILQAQNLVPNPSFDQTVTACPFANTQWNRCANWNNVNMNVGGGAWGTPDYFNTCGTGVSNIPNTGYGTCNSRSGAGMM